MSAINDGGPAFPCPIEFDQTGQLVSHGSFGMTLRDWFAGQALAGLLSQKDYGDFTYTQTAQDSYAMADAMLAARERGAK